MWNNSVLRNYAWLDLSHSNISEKVYFKFSILKTAIQGILRNTMQSFKGCDKCMINSVIARICFSLALVLMNCCVTHCPKQSLLAANYRFCSLNLLTVYFY